jgi:CheY-like chemotaxis protein
VLGDPLRVRQVLTNLLSNAVKFTAAGGRVSLTVSPVGEGQALRFSVRDTGIGMEPSEVARLFRPFSQADATTTRRFGGTGLGLSISRDLARLMGGDITVTSVAGQGSVFDFQVVQPALIAEQQLAGEVAPPGARVDGTAGRQLQGRRVLLVEDNRVNQLLARKLLEKVGVQVTLAENGLQAVEVACRDAGAFDAILMDIQMPEMDGLDATRAIRSRLGPACPPIIAMTAHALGTQRDQCLAAGMVAHLAKPVDVPMLYEVLARWVRRP